MRHKKGGGFGSADVQYEFDGKPLYFERDITKAAKTSWKGRLSRYLIKLGNLFKSRKSLDMSARKEHDTLRDLNVAKDLIAMGDRRVTPENAIWRNGKRA